MQLNLEFVKQQKDRLHSVTVGPLHEMPERVLQFGEGNFLRAFVDWKINELNRRGLFNGKVVVVQPLPDGMAEELNEQNCVYTVVRRGLQQGQPVEHSDIITSISRAINPYTHWNEFLACAENPDLRYIVSNTTEAGIVYVETPQPNGECPASFPAKVTTLLFKRFHHFSGARDKGMIIIPCELIDRNGHALKENILAHAESWQLGNDFVQWINESCFFYDTLVDRIVPGFPRDEAEDLYRKLGYEDELLVASELFHLWVIEGNGTARKELRFVDAGLNVVWTDNLRPYRTLKVHILNGTHTSFAIPAFLAGKDTVRQSLEDEAIGRFVQQAVFDEIVPTLDAPDDVRKKFAETVLERFRNPFLKHGLLAITLNSVSKFKVRVLPSLLRYQQAHDAIPQALSFSLAALIAFYRGEFNGSTSLVGWRGGKHYLVQDDPQHLEFFASTHAQCRRDEKKLCETILGNVQLWDMDLNTVPGLTHAVVRHYSNILHDGVMESLAIMSERKTHDDGTN
ncbi:MAG: tagaturonate reductase [Ignavibacteriae bacterium]|nr:tagaturonate reductase [Ignavibacteriota bacterium]